jgi:hypothetical protein
VRGEAVTDESIKFRADGVEGSRAVVRIALPSAPKAVTVAGVALPSDAYDYADTTLRIRFKNTAEGVDVVIQR